MLYLYSLDKNTKNIKKMNKKKSPQLKPYSVDAKKGKKYAWCSCGLSSKQPYCDGSHSATEFKPVIFTSKSTETIYLCGCKHTKKSPFCDGSHKFL